MVSKHGWQSNQLLVLMVNNGITSAVKSDSPPQCSFVANATRLTPLQPAAYRERYVLRLCEYQMGAYY